MKVITEQNGIYIDRVREGQIVVGLHPSRGPVILRNHTSRERWLWYILTDKHDLFDGNGHMTFSEALDWAVRNKVEMYVFNSHKYAYQWVADNCQEGDGGTQVLFHAPPCPLPTNPKAFEVPEHIKNRETDWSKVPIDTLVEIVHGICKWKRYFAGTSTDGKPMVWNGGATSETTNIRIQPDKVRLI